MINFTGNFIHNSTVLKRTSGNNYSKEKVAFVELDMKSSDDQQFIHAINDTWHCSKDFVKVMCDNFDYYHRNPDAPRPPQIFLLTEQQDFFEKLDPQKALGLTQTGKGLVNNIEIELLQTNPKYLNVDGKSDIRYIGTTILDSLKDFFGGSILTLYAIEGTTQFYKKNHFKERNHYDKGKSLQFDTKEY